MPLLILLGGWGVASILFAAAHRRFIHHEIRRED